MTTISIEQSKVLEKEDSKLVLSKKLEILEFKKQLIQLHDKMQKIEDRLGEKAAENYLKGYLEDHSIPMDDFIKTIKNI